MREPMDQCGQCPDQPLTAEKIIKELILIAPVADTKKGLHDLFVSWVQHEDLMAGDYKDTVLNTYTGLNDLIDSISKLKTLKQ